MGQNLPKHLDLRWERNLGHLKVTHWGILMASWMDLGLVAQMGLSLEQNSHLDSQRGHCWGSNCHWETHLGFWRVLH